MTPWEWDETIHGWLNVDTGEVWTVDDVFARIEALRGERHDTVTSLSNLRAYCLDNFQGGYTHEGDEAKLAAFVHGMETVCDVAEKMAAALAGEE